MRKKENYPEWLDEVESALDNRVILYLKEYDERYDAALQRRKKLIGKYPIFDRLEDGAGEITLNDEQHEAYREYLSARSEVEALERKGFYIMGQAEASYYAQVAKRTLKKKKERKLKDKVREKYFTVEDGREQILEKVYDKAYAISSAQKNPNAKEVFAFNKADELIGCIWSRKDGEDYR